MDVTTHSKSRAQNRLEGFALTAIFLGFPTFACTALMLELIDTPEVVGHHWDMALFVALATILHAWLMPHLAPRLPNMFGSASTPCFFDGTLSLQEKITRWCTRPAVSMRLVVSLIGMSLLAACIAVIR